MYLINVTYSDSTSHVIYRRYSKFFELQVCYTISRNKYSHCHWIPNCINSHRCTTRRGGPRASSVRSTFGRLLLLGRLSERSCLMWLEPACGKGKGGNPVSRCRKKTWPQSPCKVQTGAKLFHWPSVTFLHFIVVIQVQPEKGDSSPASNHPLAAHLSSPHSFIIQEMRTSNVTYPHVGVCDANK